MYNVTGRSFERLKFRGTYSMESGYLGRDIQQPIYREGVSVVQWATVSLFCCRCYGQIMQTESHFNHILGLYEYWKLFPPLRQG